MKKISKIIAILSLSIAFLISHKFDFYAASASLSGPSTVRAGDTITLNLVVSHDGSYGLSGTLSYDSSQVTLESKPSCNVAGWTGDSNGNYLTAYDNNLTNPLSGNVTVLSFKFKVNSSVAAGTQITIAVKDLISSDGNADTGLGVASYSVTVAAPLSGNANLSSLSVSEGTLSPAFKAATTSYSIGEVDYSVSKLNISYKTEDSKATVSISGNNLAVGANTVSVTVKAENGATKTYKISVTRKQDPNYVPSANAALKEITLNSGVLSPGFSEDKTDYIVYLPYEYVGKEFSVTGSAADSKASGVTGGTIAALVEGVNTTTVVCKAEDGTEKTYKITVVVMPEYNGAVPNIEGVDAPGEDDTEMDSTELEPSTEDNMNNINSNNGNKGNPAGPIAIVVIIILIIALVYVLFFLNKRNRM